jgi:hypothetical protein
MPWTWNNKGSLGLYFSDILQQPLPYAPVCYTSQQRKAACKAINHFMGEECIWGQIACTDVVCTQCSWCNCQGDLRGDRTCSSHTRFTLQCPPHYTQNHALTASPQKQNLAPCSCHPTGPKLSFAANAKRSGAGANGSAQASYYSGMKLWRSALQGSPSTYVRPIQL